MKLKYDNPLSNLVFHFNLRHYSLVDYRVSFIVRFDNLPRSVANSPGFQADLRKQIAHAAGRD